MLVAHSCLTMQHHGLSEVVTHQSPLSMGFPRQEYCNFLLQGLFLILKPRSSTSKPLRKPKYVLNLFFNFLVKKCFIEVFITVVQFTQGECLETHRLSTALMLAEAVTCVWWTCTGMGWRSELMEPWVTPWSPVTGWFTFRPFPATDKNECLFCI